MEVNVRAKMILKQACWLVAVFVRQMSKDKGVIAVNQDSGI